MFAIRHFRLSVLFAAWAACPCGGKHRLPALPTTWLLVAAALLAFSSPAGALIDPERPASWLVSQSKTIAALKVSSVEKGSATFAVTKVLKGELPHKSIVVRWTALQRPPADAQAVGSAAVLLMPKDQEDPGLVHLGPEYLSVMPDAKRAGEYEFLRLNGFVKGSFNGESADLIALIEDLLADRAYFPIWADTSFAPARKIGELPGAASVLAVGDLDGDGSLEIVAGTSEGVVVLTEKGTGSFSASSAEKVPVPFSASSAEKVPVPFPAGTHPSLQLADADGDGKTDILTSAGLFINKGGGQFAPVENLAKCQWQAAGFCHVPGRPSPAVVAVEAGKAVLFARGKDGVWADITAEMGLDKAPDKALSVDARVVGEGPSERLAVVVLTAGMLTCFEAPLGKPLKQVHAVRLAGADEAAPKNVHLCQRDLDNDGLEDVVLAADGWARWFSRRVDGTLVEVIDHLGDVRNMFRPVQGLGGLICEDFNNDGLTDLLAWSKSPRALLVMNRGYHNLREATALFDLPAAMKNAGDIQAAAAADIDSDGDLDLLVSCGKAVYLLANTFETDPEEANERPRNRLLTVRAPGRFGALVTVCDKDGKAMSSRRMGTGPAAETLHFGYLSARPAAVLLKTADGKTLRQDVPPGSSAKPILFKQ